MNWPLATPIFTTADKLKIGWWLLRGKQWTQGPEVRAYEQTWERYTGAKHAIMVANGSVANELIARRRRDELRERGIFSSRVIVPACTWVSSVSPWIREGFDPVWCDISTNLCVSMDEIARKLAASGAKTVFYTTLLGNTVDLVALRRICEHHGARLMLDNCESSFSTTPEGFGYAYRHVCSVETSSTSFYFSHPATTGTEGGMIFCESDDEADWYRMMRNHGMTRGMPAKYHNREAHPAFDFYIPGSNFRSSDLQAYMGRLTFERSLAFAPRRSELAALFYAALDRDLYSDITLGGMPNPMMALPIVPNPTNRQKGSKAVIELLDRLGIENRPIVGGNLLRHTAFAKYGDARLFPRAQHAHDHGAYVGLHAGVTADMALELAEALNG